MFIKIKDFLMLAVKKLTKWFLRWLVAFGYIIDGVINLVTFGFLPHRIQPKVTIKLAKIYSAFIFRMDV